MLIYNDQLYPISSQDIERPTIYYFTIYQTKLNSFFSDQN